MSVRSTSFVGAIALACFTAVYAKLRTQPGEVSASASRDIMSPPMK